MKNIVHWIGYLQRW